uniref:Uncharacterized protein n=1 Tax=Spironucleus salmonicida TaxID=348837 RepID=V6LU87_9EUKA|eukprot:EST44369.1 Hypothetical protein SS50377_15672 [Spironucleus salmonicida]
MARGEHMRLHVAEQGLLVLEGPAGRACEGHLQRSGVFSEGSISGYRGVIRDSRNLAASRRPRNAIYDGYCRVPETVSGAVAGIVPQYARWSGMDQRQFCISRRNTQVAVPPVPKCTARGRAQQQRIPPQFQSKFQ